MTPKAITNFFNYLKEAQVQFVDFRFTDLDGTWHHLIFAIEAVDENLLSDGLFFDGSSLPYWSTINESDLYLRPDITEDLKCVFVDPFASSPTAIVICDVYNPLTQTAYDKDPRFIGRQAENYLKASGIADTAYFGPEAEFFIFDGISYTTSPYASRYAINCGESTNTSVQIEDNHGFRMNKKSGYSPVGPVDSISNMRGEMTQHMQEMGLSIEKHHHEVAPGQHEIGFRFDSLLHTADNIQIYKYVVRNTAYQYGKTATFMPKPIFGDNGSGMHVHQSLWLDNQNIFSGREYAGLSKTALYYIGGILKHGKSLNAITNPTTNSYKRLVKGYEAPTLCGYSMQNRSAACRIPIVNSPAAKRVEMRFPDPSACGYLAMSAMLMAGLDGIKNEIDPGTETTQNLFEETKSKHKPESLATSLREALEVLEKDHNYLLAGGVFNEHILESYLEMKWQEVHELEKHPHPWEFTKYYNK